MSPLPAGEHPCFMMLRALPGVKLPGLLSVNGRLEPITVLECVLRRAPMAFEGAQKLDCIMPSPRNWSCLKLEDP